MFERCRVTFAVVLSATLLCLIQAISTPAHAVTFERDTSIDLNGSAQYGYAGNSTALRTFNAITIEFWAKPDVTCSGNMVAKNLDYAVYCSAGELSYAFSRTGVSWVGVNTSVKIPTNEWHHIAVVRPTGTATAYVYLDGQLHYTGTADSASTSAISSNASTFLNVGARGQSTTYFNGSIDEVRIFNAARTEVQIESDMHTWGNLGLSSVVAYYDFNNVSGSTIFNKALNPDANSDLTINGSPTFPTIESSVASGDQIVTTFPRSYLNSSGGWFGPDGVSKYWALIVAGGGGGGMDEGGGGGAGGLIDSRTVVLAADSAITIDVGQGGRGAVGLTGNYGTADLRGDSGQNSQLGSITAVGGGGGGSSKNVANDSARNGGSGGSGGGGAGEVTAGHAGGAGTAGQGYGGGVGINASSGGGGGGASEAGNTDGNFLGGDGVASSITGSSITYAGGGAGGGGNTSATQYAGGAGGGGTGGSSTLANTSGTAGLGGGGGGGCGNLACGPDGVAYSGASGGSGVIILRYMAVSAVALTSISYSSTPTKSTATTITIGINVAGKVSFTASGARIKNCLTRNTSGASPSYTVTCSWKPSVNGTNSLEFRITPTDSNFNSTTVKQNVVVLRRANTRN
jgi:hypothetical protein